MTPGVRRLALTTHVTASVGWLGAVVVAGIAIALMLLVIAGHLTGHGPGRH